MGDDTENETDWGLCWKGQYVLSHRTYFSAGVAVLVSPGLNVHIVSTTETEVVSAEILNISFCFVNIYALNLQQGSRTYSHQLYFHGWCQSPDWRM